MTKGLKRAKEQPSDAGATLPSEARARRAAGEGSADPIDPRQTILARRAQFVAAALASAGLAASLEGCSPCLSMVPPAQSPESTAESPDGGAGEDVMPEPAPCLRPQPCLEPEPAPCLSPQVCLSEDPLVGDDEIPPDAPDRGL